ncbi:hypothetical protein [Peribacillus simplex]|uniref:hypothetical protein n=1 Tax=Peribacillus simplex TaxID=1478 RepID=UPI003D285E39
MKYMLGILMKETILVVASVFCLHLQSLMIGVKIGYVQNGESDGGGLYPLPNITK